MIKNFQIFESIYSSPSYGYRAGDLDRKAETLANFRGGRGTGHFGTGFYFFGSEEQAKNYAKPISVRYGMESDEPSRPISKVDFSKYKLFKIYNFEFGLKFHDILKEINHTGFRGFENQAKEMIWDDEESGDKNKDEDIKIRIHNLIENRRKKAKELLEFIGCPKYRSDKDFYHSDVSESYDLINNYVYYHSSKTKKGHWFDIEKEIDEKIKKFANWIEKDKDIDGVDWKADENKIKDFFNKYKTEVESDKVKKSKYFKECITKLSKKLAIMVSNMEYAENFTSDKPRRNSEEISKIIEKVIVQNLKQDPYNSATYNDDTKSTKIMKALGYEGIDVRGVKDLDNSTFGSIIYDIKK